MGVINLSENEKRSLAAIDERDVQQAIDQAVSDVRSTSLRRFPLFECGQFVAAKLRQLEEALIRHSGAKAPRKRDETRRELERAGRDLSFAVGQMKRRMLEEEKDAQFFHVDDQVMPPYKFTKELRLRVSYRWRRAIDHDWTYGSITFCHEVDPRPKFPLPPPRKKLTAARQQQELQDRLFHTWEYRMNGALYSVRDYFRAGKDGNAIPKTFKVVVDTPGNSTTTALSFGSARGHLSDCDRPTHPALKVARHTSPPAACTRVFVLRAR